MRQHKWILLAGGLFGAIPGVAPAAAADCAKGLVCASDPQTIVKAMNAAGYETVLTSAESTGAPLIVSKVSDADFAVVFEDCKDKKDCTTLQFAYTFQSKSAHEIATKVNDSTRFVTAGVDGEDILVSMDITTVGGLNQTNFDSVLDYWAAALTQAISLLDDKKH